MAYQEDDMLGTNPCSLYWADAFTKIHNILSSDGWKLVLLSLGLSKLIVYYCLRSRHYEARVLAAAAIVFSMLVILIAVTEWRTPAMVRQVFACSGSDAPARVASANIPSANRRLLLGESR
jgi:hypothetical protein